MPNVNILINRMEPTCYVKGLDVSRVKIQSFLNADDGDGRIDLLTQKILDSTDRELHRFVLGRRLTDKRVTIVISLGVDAFSYDLEELKKKDFPIPKYLRGVLEDLKILSGPDVYEVASW